VNKYVSEKELPGVASCTITANDYNGYYVEEYNPGKLGIQPHNFVIKDGKPIEIQLYDNLKIGKNNFQWLTHWLSHNNKTIEPERSYKADQSGGPIFVLKTNGAHISVILQHDFIKPQKMNITSAFFAPFGDKKLTKTVNLKTGIFFA